MANTPSEKGSPPVAGKSSAPVSQSGKRLPWERFFGRRFAEWFRNLWGVWKVMGTIVTVLASLVVVFSFVFNLVEPAPARTYAFYDWWHDFGRNKIVEIDSEVRKPRYIFSLDRLDDDRLATRDDVEKSIYDLKFLFFWGNSDEYLKHNWNKNILYFWNNSDKHLKYNWNETLTWLKKSAEWGYAEAQNTLGVLYWNGWAVEWDKNVALQWWKKAANQNYKYAQHNLAVYHWRNSLDRNDWYNTRQLLEKVSTQKTITQEEKNRNKDEAIRYWKKSSNQGLAAAQYNLANIYWDRIGTSEEIPQDAEKAIKLYEGASGQEHLKSRFYLSRAHILKKYLEFNKRIFVRDWEYLANSNNVEKSRFFFTSRSFKDLAIYNLAVDHATGEGVTKKDLKKSEEWFKEISSYIFPHSNASHVHFMLGNIYLSIFQKTIWRFANWIGLLDLLEYVGYKNDLYKQVESSYHAAHQGNYTPAQYALAFFYWEGKNGRKNREEAVRLLKIAAGLTSKLDSHRSPYKNNNYCLAQHALGLVYWWGEGGEEKNRDKAYYWFEKAADQGLAESYYYLARYHYKKFAKNNSGESARQNLKDSYKYYIVSRDLGYAYKHTQKQGERIREILEKEITKIKEATSKIETIKKQGENLADERKKMKNCN